MNLKKICAAALAATMMAGVVGCSSSKPATTEDKELTATIKVWSPQEDQSKDSGNWLQKQCDAFNKAHPKWKLTFDYGVCSEADAGKVVSQDPSAAADV